MDEIDNEHLKTALDFLASRDRRDAQPPLVTPDIQAEIVSAIKAKLGEQFVHGYCCHKQEGARKPFRVWAASNYADGNGLPPMLVIGSADSWEALLAAVLALPLPEQQRADWSEQFASAWPPRDIVAKLVDASEILLHQHNYDGHGYEAIGICVDLAKSYLRDPSSPPSESVDAICLRLEQLADLADERVIWGWNAIRELKLREVTQCLREQQARIKELEIERDLALAHDTQPYPTADAYEKVCAALNAAKTRLDAADKLATQLEQVVKQLYRRLTRPGFAEEKKS